MDLKLDLELIQGLVRILEESTLTEMEIKEGDFRLSMSKLDHPPVISGGAAVPSGGTVQLSPAAPAASGEAGDTSAAEEEQSYIVSPIVGTFYSAPAPDAPAYVKVGDRIRNGQTVCILEAMKLMNEIQCEFDCEIEAVLVSNEQKVEYGQPLFRVKKL